MDDWQLLADYAHRHSEEAFRTLVDRYVGLVYHAALRHAGNPYTAEEVTQAVFIALAQKAGRIPSGTILSGWLFRATRYAFNNLAREEMRRRDREQEAVMMQTILRPDETESAWEQIVPHLNDALDKLSRNDREAILIRFFQEKSHKEVAQMLGVSEDAAKVRVSRAVEKLRLIFAARGFVAPSAVLLATLSAHSAQAVPTGLTASVATLAMAKGTTGTASTLTIAKGILKLMAWTKAKTALAVGVGVLFTAGTTTITVKQIQERRTYPWQDMVDGGSMALKALDTTSPQVRILRSKFTANPLYGGRLIDDIGPKDRWRYIGIHKPPLEIVRAAFDGYGVNVALPSELVLPPEMPDGYYDFIANLANGSTEALAGLVKKKFGLVGKHEMRDMEVLLLVVARPDAPGLKPGTPLRPGQQRQASLVTNGIIHYKDWPITKVAQYLERELQIPVVDRTGLTGNYDMDVPEIYGATPDERMEATRQMLLDEFGLKLVPSRELHEVFIVEKVK